MTNHEILYKLAEKIIRPDGHNYSMLCFPCPQKDRCDANDRKMCTETLASFIHEELVEIVGGEIIIDGAHYFSDSVDEDSTFN